MVLNSKYRINRKDSRNNHRVGVDQQISVRAWAPLAGTYGTFSVEEMADTHENQLKRTYGAFLHLSCLECDSIAESNNQTKCKYCGAKLTSAPDDKPQRGRPKK